MNVDLYTKERIRSKDKRTEELSLFQSRKNMIDFFKTEKDIEVLSRTSLDLFINRKKLKKLLFAPSTVELRSSILPTVQLLSKIGLNYREISLAAGLHFRYDYENIPTFPIKSDLEVWIDTREQNPIRLGCHTKHVALSFGDYCCSANYNNVYIERKSLADLVSTISQGYDRFNKEIETAFENDGYLFVLVENEMSQALTFDYLPYMKYTQAKPEFIFNRIKTICQTYPNIQFVFCKGRTHMSEVIKKIFSFKDKPQTYDWQYLVDNKIV